MLGDCKCCVAYKDEIQHLRGLLDQTLGLIAPKSGPVPDEPQADQPDKDIVNYGE